MARDVFISYRSVDQAWAQHICDALAAHNVTYWIAPRDIPPGMEWAASIIDGINHCHTLVLILSSNSIQSKQITREVELADRLGHTILTFRVEDVQPPPGLQYFLNDIQWLDGFGIHFDAAVEQLVQAVHRSPKYPAATKEEVAAIVHDLPPAASPVSAPAPKVAARNPLLIGAAVVAVLAIAGGTWYFASRPGTQAALVPAVNAVPVATPAPDSNDPQALFAAAESYQAAGDVKNAIAAYTKFLAIRLDASEGPMKPGVKARVIVALKNRAHCELVLGDKTAETADREKARELEAQ